MDLRMFACSFGKLYGFRACAIFAMFSYGFAHRFVPMASRISYGFADCVFAIVPARTGGSAVVVQLIAEKGRRRPPVQ